MYGHPVALIDLGSNTVRLVVYALGEERALKERVKGAEKIGEEKCFLGLWSERKGSELSEKGFRDLVAVLCQQDQYARRMGCGKILCFATASLRGLSHRVTEALEAETGLRIWQMEEKEEIFCDCKSLQLFLPEQVSKGLGCDIGGGSGQIFLYEENGPQQGVSLPIGSLRLAEEWFPEGLYSREQLDRLDIFLDQLLEKVPFFPQYEECLYGMGGSVRGVKKMGAALELWKEASWETISLPMLDRLQNLLIGESGKELLLKYMPERWKTLPAGLAVLRGIVRKAGADRICPVSNGVREGVLWMLLSQGENFAFIK